MEAHTSHYAKLQINSTTSRDDGKRREHSGKQKQCPRPTRSRQFICKMSPSSLFSVVLYTPCSGANLASFHFFFCLRRVTCRARASYPPFLPVATTILRIGFQRSSRGSVSGFSERLREHRLGHSGADFGINSSRHRRKAPQYHGQT